MKILTLIFFMAIPVKLFAGTLYVDTGGLATNSGSTDSPTATVSLATVTISGTQIQWPGGTDLSSVVTSGATQSSVYVQGATNSNQQIFWVASVDDGLDITSVTVAITGVTNSSATLGGQHVWTSARIEGAVRAGDKVIINNDVAAVAATVITARNAGTSAGGYVVFEGKSGVRPKLTTTNTSVVVNTNSLALIKISNLELIQQGASGNAVTASGVGFWADNVKVSDAGGHGFSLTGTSNMKITRSEVSGVGLDGINIGGASASHFMIFGNYIHDAGDDGIQSSVGGAGLNFTGNTVDTCGGNGLNDSSLPGASVNIKYVFGNTIYNSGVDGINISDDDSNMLIVNNLLLDNGNVGTEYNIDAASPGNLVLSMYNIYSIAGGIGGGNTNNVSLSATDLTSDPLLTNAATGDFTPATNSPALGAGYPGSFLGGSTGYLDIGAIQKETSSGGFTDSFKNWSSEF